MAEPPAKRARRGDSAGTWEQSDRAAPPRRDDRRGKYGRDDRRERHEGRRERTPDRGPGGVSGRRDHRDARDGRDGRGKRDRSRSRERNPPRRDEVRARSRSPQREGAREGVRRRSPPRGPRGGAQSERAANGGDRPSSSKTGPTQPSAKVPNGPRAPAVKNESKREDVGDAIDPKTEPGDDDDMEAQMRKMMGFGNFRTTKNTKVPGNDKNYAVRKEKKTEYRQYMNRVGGFNRPLSPSR